MPTQSSGPISFSDLNLALGTGTPLSINELYRGGTYVPDIDPNSDIPTSGEINLQEMYSTWVPKSLAFTITVGSAGIAKKSKAGSFYGFGNVQGVAFGSISNATYLSPNGTMTIQGLYYNTNAQAWYLQIGSSSTPTNTDLSFRTVSATGYTINGIRSAATITQTVGTSRTWQWNAQDTSHPVSGTIACILNYYG